MVGAVVDILVVSVRFPRSGSSARERHPANDGHRRATGAANRAPTEREEKPETPDRRRQQASRLVSRRAPSSCLCRCEQDNEIQRPPRTTPATGFPEPTDAFHCQQGNDQGDHRRDPLCVRRPIEQKPRDGESHERSRGCPKGRLPPSFDGRRSCRLHRTQATPSPRVILGLGASTHRNARWRSTG